ncbi:MAG: NADH-quinone oxidoreductase subunit J [Gloeocapsa sp. DLM2.Bin57]|nr:MAG: NADH-quinone oxidoreductase subunit J [Gloeocapsa sp. DLM2.Bin57]
MNIAEGVQFVCFFVLTGMMLSAAVGVVLLENIVYSAFLLAVVFLSISGLYILLNADFVAAAQILIYVGAVNVLIIFAIMLVNKQEDFATIPKRWIRKVATGLVCLSIFALLTTMILITPWSLDATSPALIENTVIELAKHLFSDFLLPFELASVVLLMAMVGAIILARRDLIPDTTTSPLTLPERPRELASVSSKSTED